MSKPKFLKTNPPPIELDRHFGGKRLHVWFGKAHIDDINGWVDNPRINLQRKRMQEVLGERELSQDEVFELMKNDKEIKLKALRDDILKNELKEPIILSKSGKLLDGNRRFFAVKYLLESMDAANPSRSDYELIPCYVLNDSSTPEEEALVLVEENFSPSLKQEWPDYVKAQFINQELDNGLSTADIARKFNWKKSKVEETIRINKVLDEFCGFAEAEEDLEDEYGGGLGLSETESAKLAADNYQFFNEAQKSFRKELDSDLDFKVAFFRWIAEGKFKSFPEVRIAYKAWTDSEARSVLASDDPRAAKDAKAIIDYGERVLKGKQEAKTKIEDFVKYLSQLTTAEIEGIPKPTIQKINNALSIVAKMSLAAKEANK